MNSINVFLFVLYAMITLLGACNNQNVSQPVQNQHYTDTIIMNKRLFIQKNIPQDSMLEHRAFLLGLEPIANGYSDLQLRFWYELYDTSRLLVIKQKNGERKSELYNYGFTSSNDSAYLVLHEKIKNIVLVTEWEKLLNMLDSLKVKDIADEKFVIKNPAIFVEGGNLYTVEFAEKSTYRSYSYTQPCYYKDEYREANNLCQILNFLEKTFNIYANER